MGVSPGWDLGGLVLLNGHDGWGDGCGGEGGRQRGLTRQAQSWKSGLEKLRVSAWPFSGRKGELPTWVLEDHLLTP